MGREKDVIIRGGRNIDVTEVERAVASHPGVRQVCVVPVPDPLLGERVAALVVSAGGPLDLAEITRHLAEQGMAKTKWPEFVFDVGEIPQTQVGKVARAEAREVAGELARDLARDLALRERACTGGAPFSTAGGR